MKKNILDLFLDKLMAFPLWVKQIIYLQLYRNLLSFLSEDFIVSDLNDIFHLYKPDLSYTGKSELEEKKCGFDDNIYKFMRNIDFGMNLFEIAMNNYWTMEEISKYFILCAEQGFVYTPDSKYVISMARYMAGKYKTGEYFRSIGKISDQQLQQAIDMQKEVHKSGKHVKIADLLISLGYLTEKDCNALLVLKDEARVRFIPDAEVVPEVSDESLSSSQEVVLTSEKEAAYIKQIDELKRQNKKLEDRYNKIILFMKKSHQHEI